MAVVVGGGNFFRGKDKEGKGLDRASADYMGCVMPFCFSCTGPRRTRANGSAAEAGRLAAAV